MATNQPTNQRPQTVPRFGVNGRKTEIEIAMDTQPDPTTTGKGNNKCNARKSSSDKCRCAFYFSYAVVVSAACATANAIFSLLLLLMMMMMMRRRFCRSHSCYIIRLAGRCAMKPIVLFVVFPHHWLLSSNQMLCFTCCG